MIISFKSRISRIYGLMSFLLLILCCIQSSYGTDGVSIVAPAEVEIIQSLLTTLPPVKVDYITSNSGSGSSGGSSDIGHQLQVNISCTRCQLLLTPSSGVRVVSGSLISSIGSGSGGGSGSSIVAVGSTTTIATALNAMKCSISSGSGDDNLNISITSGSSSSGIFIPTTTTTTISKSINLKYSPLNVLPEMVLPDGNKVVVVSDEYSIVPISVRDSGGSSGGVWSVSISSSDSNGYIIYSNSTFSSTSGNLTTVNNVLSSLQYIYTTTTTTATKYNEILDVISIIVSDGIATISGTVLVLVEVPSVVPVVTGPSSMDCESGGSVSLGGVSISSSSSDSGGSSSSGGSNSIWYMEVVVIGDSTLSVAPASGDTQIPSVISTSTGGSSITTILVSGSILTLNRYLARLTVVPIGVGSSVVKVTISTTSDSSSSNSIDILIDTTTSSGLITLHLPHRYTTNEDTPAKIGQLNQIKIVDIDDQLLADNELANSIVQTSISSSDGSIYIDNSCYTNTTTTTTYKNINKDLRLLSGKWDNSTSTIFVGSVTSTNTALSCLVYLPSKNFNSETLRYGVVGVVVRGYDVTTQSVITSDGGGANGTTLINVLPINDAPVIVSPQRLTIYEDTGGSVSGVVCSDIDGGLLELTITPSFGTVKVGSGSSSGGNIKNSNDGSSIVISGSVYQINTILLTLTFTPHLHFNGEEGIQFTLIDNYNSATTTTTIMEVLPVNDAPTIIGARRQILEKDEKFKYITTVVVDDVDLTGKFTSNFNAHRLLTVTLNVMYGSVSMAANDVSWESGKSNIPSSGSGGGGDNIVITGAVDSINSALRSLTYRPSGSSSGSIGRVDMISILVSDRGNFGLPPTYIHNTTSSGGAITTASSSTATEVLTVVKKIDVLVRDQINTTEL